MGGGLVAITSGCSVVDLEIAFVIGIIGGIVYYASSQMLLRLHIDDVVDASPVHYFCGIWGVISAGLLAKPENVEMSYGIHESCGAFYKCHGHGGPQLAANLVFIIATSAWVGVIGCIVFGILKAAGCLRVSEETEDIGMDMAEHGGAAYESSYRKSIEAGMVYNNSNILPPPVEARSEATC